MPPKQRFEVVPGLRELELLVTRDSVAAGDDVWAPHEKTFKTPAFTDPVVLVGNIYPGYLPLVAGTGHSWSVLLNDRLIATISGGRVRSESSPVYDGRNVMHFVYNSRDPLGA